MLPIENFEFVLIVKKKIATIIEEFIQENSDSLLNQNYQILFLYCPNSFKLFCLKTRIYLSSLYRIFTKV